MRNENLPLPTENVPLTALEDLRKVLLCFDGWVLIRATTIWRNYELQMVDK